MLIVLAFILLFVLDRPWNLVGFVVAAILGFVEIFFWNRTVKKRKAATGPDTLIGRDAVVSTPCRPVGQVKIDGEIWSARCEDGASPGETVRILGRRGLELLVTQIR